MPISEDREEGADVALDKVKENLLGTKPEGEPTMDINTTGEIEDDDTDDTTTTDEDTTDDITEDEPFKTFKTQEEYDSFIAEERAKVAESQESGGDDDEDEKDEVPQFFDPNFKPKDWNDYTFNLLKNPAVKEYLSKNYAGDIRKEIDDMSAAEKKELLDINATYDEQYDSLAKDGKVPERSTPEGKAIDKQISVIGATYGQTSMIKAYEIWSKIPVSEGGGLDYTAPTNKKITQQKQKSGLIGSSRKGTKTDTTKVKQYEDIHNKSLDEQVQEQLDE